MRQWRWIPAVAGMTVLVACVVLACGSTLSAEWISTFGKPARVNDVIEVQLKDLHPTQPAIGFDRIYYKLGRYAQDRRKVFDEYCETNGQKGVRDFSRDSDLHDPTSFTCWERVGMDRKEMKTVVIGPDNNLYVTDGHHTFNAYWEVPGGGPDLRMYVIVARDYREYKSMDDFWEQMRTDNNVWLLNVDAQPITPADLPQSLGLANFENDTFRALMYFTRRVAWFNPGQMSVPDPDFEGDNYPDFPFVEFYWTQEIRKSVNLSDYDLMTRSGYVAAMRAVGEAILKVETIDVGGILKSAKEMGQFTHFNEKELFRLNRPTTGKLSYMLDYKNRLRKPSSPNVLVGDPVVNQSLDSR